MANRAPRFRRTARGMATALLMAAASLSAGARPAVAEPAMWALRGPAGTAVLYGTHHGVSLSPRWDTAKLQTALAAAAELWFEAAPPPRPTAAELSPSGPAAPSAALLLPPGTTLEAQLTAEDRRLLSDAEQALGASPALMSRLSPAAAEQVILRLAQTRAGAPPGGGVEPILELRAKAQGATVNGLETPDPKLISALAFPGQGRELESLREALRDYPQMAQARARTVALWEAGDLAGLTPVCEQGMTPKLHEAVVASRNRVFALRIAERLRAPGAIFVAVGVCHLVGDDSLIPLLKAAGVTVDRQ